MRLTLNNDNKLVTYSLCAVISVCVFTEFLLNCTPPITRDALVHHLAIPKLWLLNGGFYEIPWADYSYYPMYINLLYLVCLCFENDIAPKFIHLLFGFSTGVLIYRYLRQKYDGNWGLLGMIIFITTPIVIWLSTSAYIDLGMTFFTTASILALVKWCDNEYKPFKWLLLSSVCMGIAVGSKYNALLAFLIVNLLVIFLYARNTEKQIASIKYGLIFAFIAALTASPWYLKNYFLTGNPFYPLFNTFFQSLHQHSIENMLQYQAMKKTGGLNFFQMRELMYGETLWEILLIPLRVFFQGSDYGYRYFQGVLNPVLIVFAPFILIDKKYRRDKFIFSVFSIVFMLLAYFLTKQQVRYLLPIFPFLAILAVMGIKNLAEYIGEIKYFSSWPETFNLSVRNSIFFGVIVLLSFNFVYLKNRVNIIKPFAYISGPETKNEFLRRHLSYFPAVEYINSSLSNDAIILTLFLGRQGYYLDRTYRNSASFGMNVINEMIYNSDDKKKFGVYTQSLNATHLLMPTGLFSKYLKDNFSYGEITRLIKLLKQSWKLIYNDNKFMVFDLKAG